MKCICGNTISEQEKKLRELLEFGTGTSIPERCAKCLASTVKLTLWQVVGLLDNISVQELRELLYNK